MNYYGGGGYGTQNQNQNQSQNQQQQKHDVFVGNLAFSTTEEQLHQAFSEIGRILKVRMVSDLETGKPRGFAFIEFEDPQAALSAIRNMNDYELNGRRIRVNFSNSSHLETLAGKLGMDMSQAGTGGKNDDKNKDKDNKDKDSNNAGSTAAIADALKSFTKLEMYEVISQFKELADKDPDEARKLLSGHPQLPEAILHLMSKLDMIKTPLDGTGATNLLNPASAVASIVAPVPPPPPVANVVPPQPPNKPSGMPVDPRQQQQQHPSDPRARADPRRQDPRQQQQQPPPNFAHPPPMFQQPPPNFSHPPPQMNVVAPPPAVPGLDATLVQQVMSLTPQQISQLPPDKQQSILSLRNQITQQMGAATGAR